MTSMRAFIFDESRLPLRATIKVVGRTGRVASNDQGLLEVLSSICAPASNDTPVFGLLVFVHEEPSLPSSIPHFRGLHHLVFARFGLSNLFIFDLASHSITAAITEELAHDHVFWRERLLPIAVGVLGAGIGVLPLHAACLSLDGKGLLIAGASGTGKSTLSLALAKNGVDFLSDDWTYITHDDRQLCAHGLGAPIKLLPNSVQHFPELRRHNLQISLNGELAYELSPGDALKLRVERQCNPKWLVFYERVASGQPELVRLAGGEARKYVHSSLERLPLQLSRIEEQRERIASQIAELSCWRFRHAGSPHLAAQTLRAFFAPLEVGIPA
jgi:hypothetical protein